MATYFPVDVSGIDMLNTVFNFYISGVTITGSQNAIDQDSDTRTKLSDTVETTFSLGQLVYSSKITIDGIYLYYTLSCVDTYVTNDYGNSWHLLSDSDLASADSSHLEFTIPSAYQNLTGVKLLWHNCEDCPAAPSVNRLAVFAKTDGSNPIILKDESGSAITSLDFGTIHLSSGVTQVFQVYNNGSSNLDNVEIYEIKDNLNDSKVYASFQQSGHTEWYNNEITLSGQLFPNSGIFVTVKFNTPSDAVFGNYTKYIRIIARDTGLVT